MTYSDTITTPLIGDTVFGTPCNDVAPGVAPEPLAGVVVSVENSGNVNLRIWGMMVYRFKEGEPVVQRYGYVSSDGAIEARHVLVWGESGKFSLLHRGVA